MTRMNKPSVSTLMGSVQNHQQWPDKRVEQADHQGGDERCCEALI